MKLGQEIPKNEFMKWIRALRSGEFRQTSNALQDTEGFCCLGVACKILIPDKNLRTFVDHESGYLYLNGELPEDQPAAPEWLQKIDDDFESISEIALSYLNDFGFRPLSGVNRENETLSFDEIADLLELVYVHRALD